MSSSLMAEPGAPPQPLFRDEERDAHVRWAQHSADALQLGGEAPR